MWKEENNNLIKTFEFKSFAEAFSFLANVALVAEELNHHPWWCNDMNKVEFKLCTHSAGNIITDKDYELANKIDEVAHSLFLIED
jgi:4a-hydroxytetrahydrobiopterin dehydratase